MQGTCVKIKQHYYDIFLWQRGYVIQKRKELAGDHIKSEPWYCVPLAES